MDADRAKQAGLPLSDTHFGQGVQQRRITGMPACRGQN